MESNSSVMKFNKLSYGDERRSTGGGEREFLIIIIVCTEWKKESLWVWAALKLYQLGSELEAIMLNMWETSLVHRSRCSVFGCGDVVLCIYFIKFHSKTCNRPKISRVMEMGKSTWLQSFQKTLRSKATRRIIWKAKRISFYKFENCEVEFP